MLQTSLKVRLTIIVAGCWNHTRWNKSHPNKLYNTIIRTSSGKQENMLLLGFVWWTKMLKGHFYKLQVVVCCSVKSWNCQRTHFVLIDCGLLGLLHSGSKAKITDNSERILNITIIVHLLLLMLSLWTYKHWILTLKKGICHLFA